MEGYIVRARRSTSFTQVPSSTFASTDFSHPMMNLVWTLLTVTALLLICQVKGNNDCYPVSDADLKADDPTKDIKRSMYIAKWPNAFSSNGLSSGGVTIWGRTKGWVTVRAGSERLNKMNYFSLDVKSGGSTTTTKYFYLKKNSDCALWYDYNDIIGGYVFKVNARGQKGEFPVALK